MTIIHAPIISNFLPHGVNEYLTISPGVQRDIYVTPMPKGLVSTRNSRKRGISRITHQGDWCRVVVAGLEAPLRPSPPRVTNLRFSASSASRKFALRAKNTERVGSWKLEVGAEESFPPQKEDFKFLIQQRKAVFAMLRRAKGFRCS